MRAVIAAVFAAFAFAGICAGQAGGGGNLGAQVSRLRAQDIGIQKQAARVDGAAFFAAPRIEGKEDEFCRRAYRLMLRGARFCKDLYREWPTEPACGYIGWGGHAEKEIEANIGMANLYAMLVTFGQYDERVTGVPRAEALRRVKGVIRYCSFTHVTGPYKCTDGEQWGDSWHDWHSSSWLAVFARSVWLVWPELDEETRRMAARVIASAADQFIGMEPPSGKIDDTKAESNAWNTLPTAIAAVMSPKHPHARQWREACSRWMMNSLSVAADKKDDTIVDGKPVRLWVTTENVHPDFTVENHKIVYPVYMWATLFSLGQSASYYLWAGEEPPQAAYHHVKDVYEVYKRLQTWEGLPAYINGSDKFLHLQVVDIFLHSFFAQVLKDPEAAYLETVELDLLERMQARFADGRIYPVEEVGPWSRVHNLGSVLGASYLLHYVRQSGVTPVSRAEFERGISGVRYFPDGKFVLHRTPDKLVSFAWSKPYRIMGLAIPREGSWLVTPHVRGFVGELIEEGETREQPFDLKSLDRHIRPDSFSVSGRGLRCAGKVEHTWTFESLPNEDVVMRQKLVAIRPVTLKQAETGTIGIGRELGSNEVRLESNQRVKTVGGLSDNSNRTLTFTSGSVKVGNRFVYEWRGTGTICYFRSQEAAKVNGAPGGYGHIEDRLCVRHVERRYRFSAGETIAEGELRVRMLH